MSYSDIALIASLIMLVTIAVDWRRGVTGLGRLRLTKEKSPDRFWGALVLYINMAFLLFWLSAKAYEPAELPQTIVIEAENQ